MTIRVQPTPNPNAHKFILPSQRFARSFNFASADAATAHPLAERLFALPGVYNVLLAQDFVTVNKLPAAEWSTLEGNIQQVIAEWEAGASGE